MYKGGLWAEPLFLSMRPDLPGSRWPTVVLALSRGEAEVVKGGEGED